MDGYKGRILGGIEAARLRFSGRETAVVMGGGPSLPHDMERVLACRDFPHLFSAKQHAWLWCRENTHDPQAIVFLEHPLGPWQEGLRVSLAVAMADGVLPVSPFPGWSAFLLDQPWWNGGFSSSLALWFACALGYEEILLAGMDCYQGERPYWYERPGWDHPCRRDPLARHLAAWEPALKHCRGTERVRAVSGPLCEIFGKWDGR